MANFDITIDKALDLTTIRLSGRIIASDIIDALQSFYQTEITTKVLWDFLEGDITDLPGSDLTVIIDAAKSFSDMRPYGKSALVGHSDLLYGLARMYASLAEVKRHPILNRAFRSKKEALDWLNRND